MQHSPEPLAERIDTTIGLLKAAGLDLAEKVPPDLRKTIRQTAALFDEIGRELTSRGALLERLAAEELEAGERIERARSLAALDEHANDAIRDLVRRGLAEQAAESERVGRHWDIKIMIASLVLGIPPAIFAGVLATKYFGG
jgi:hypothetical protein